MEPRTVTFSGYDTAANSWTLAACDLQAPEVVTHYISIPGRTDGPVDISDVLSMGQPVYTNRALTIRLESSHGTPELRQNQIGHLLRNLHGRKHDITLPPDKAEPNTHLVGRCRVSVLYADSAHCAVQVDCTCEPWQYANEEKSASYDYTTAVQVVHPYTASDKIVEPLATVEGAPLVLYSDYGTFSLGPGSYRLPGLILTPGNTNLLTLEGAGAGRLTLTWVGGVL